MPSTSLPASSRNGSVMVPKRAGLAFLLLAGLMSVSARAATVEVTIDKLVFGPAEVTAKVGDTVVWTNKDILAHTATAKNGAFNVVIGPHQTAKLIVTKAGAFDYFCKYHPNMKGRLTVTP